MKIYQVPLYFYYTFTYSVLFSVAALVFFTGIWVADIVFDFFKWDLFSSSFLKTCAICILIVFVSLIPVDIVCFIRNMSVLKKSKITFSEYMEKSIEKKRAFWKQQS